MSDRSRWSIPALLFALAAAPAVLVALLGKTMVMPPAPVHFGVVLAAAGIAACAAAALTRAGWRASDGRAMLLGTAFAGGLGIPVGTAILALTALPALRRTRRVAGLLVLQLALGLGVLALGAIGI